MTAQQENPLITRDVSSTIQRDLNYRTTTAMTPHLSSSIQQAIRGCASYWCPHRYNDQQELVPCLDCSSSWRIITHSQLYWSFLSGATISVNLLSTTSQLVMLISIAKSLAEAKEKFLLLQIKVSFHSPALPLV